MSDTVPTVPLERASEQRVDQVCDRFEAGWRDGEQPRLEEALACISEPERAVLFRELLAVELELRRGLHETPALADYLPRFPEYAELLGQLLEGGPGHRPAGLMLGDYEVLSELGRGGMGVVYLARQRHPARVVALKVIRADQLAGLAPEDRPRWLERFRTEVEAAGRLEHEHVIPIYEAGERDGQPFFAMRYVPGPSLHELARAGPLAGATAAAYLEPVARAAHFAHQHKVLHRDLKPHNIVIERGTGRPFVMDFGLAKVLEGGSALTGTRELIGTPSYMAPEQINAPERVGPATDIYGLGATLYQLLTGRPPFQAGNVAATVHQVTHDEPVPPRRLNPAIEAPLETITLKCLAKEPQRRYASAAALAEDLRRYRAGEPILARPVGWLGRGRLWCRRNRGKTALMGALAFSLAALLVAGFWGFLGQAQAIRESQIREQDQRLLAVLQATDRAEGWSERAWALVTQAAALRKDERLRDLAALSLAGLDARKTSACAALEGQQASALAFDPADGAGGRLLINGTEDDTGRPLEGARLWDSATGKLLISGKKGAGPVAFQPGGKGPLQLLSEKGALLVWDPVRNQVLGTCRMTRAKPRTGGLLGLPVVALAPNGCRVAAALVGSDGKEVVAVWQAAGELLFRLATDKAMAVRVLAFSADGNLLAGAGADGKVRLWSVPGQELLATLPMTRSAIHCLAFSRDAGRGPLGTLRGRLAAGDAGGQATVWDLAQRSALNFFRGGPYDIFGVAFNPDGTLLATGGRGNVKLYDVGTGRFLLTLESGDYITGLAFSGDGRRVAACSPQGPGRVRVWELEPARGQHELRGLNNRIARVCFSPDGCRVAALAHNWQVGIWQLPSGRLLRLVDVNPGISADNAALIFSADHHHFAFSAGHEARLWDVDRDKLLGSWLLRRGLIDRLAFEAPDRLLLFRREGLAESPDARKLRQQPVYRCYLLRQGHDPKKVFEVKEFNERIFNAAITPDGSRVVIEGVRTGPNGPERAIKAFDLQSRKELWSLSSQRTNNGAALFADVSGRILALQRDAVADDFRLVEVSTGQEVERLTFATNCLGPGADWWAAHYFPNYLGPGPGNSLFRRGDQRPILTVGLGVGEPHALAFSRDGSRFAFGNAQGTVTVADLEAIRRRLAQVGLGW